MSPIEIECIRVERKKPLDPPGGDAFYEVEFEVVSPDGTMTLICCDCPKVRVGDVWELTARLCAEE